MRLHPALILLPWCAASAAELTLESKPFRIEQSFEVETVAPRAEKFRLEPEQWQDFVITTLIEHGKAVKKGETVIAFDREGYDHRVEDLERAVATMTSELARQRAEVTRLVEQQAVALDQARRAQEAAAEDLEYFKTTGRPAAERGIEASLKRARFSLESAEEELRQLKMMYEADDLTEQTEEIILKRQKISVEMAKVQLDEREREAKRERETELPRRLAALESEARRAALAFQAIEESQPLQLAEAKLALAAREAALARQVEELKELRADATWFEWKAPADGILFHGNLAADGWQLGDLRKVLKPEASVPVHTDLISIAAAPESATFHAALDPTEVRGINPGDSVQLVGWARGTIATVTAVEPTVGVGRKVGVALKADFGDRPAPPLGTSFSCLHVVPSHPEALAVPEKALRATVTGGWTVEVKLADGKTDARPVKPGRSSGDKVEILEGLEAGQVIVVPE
jgi:hypothetical protein